MSSQPIAAAKLVRLPIEAMGPLFPVISGQKRVPMSKSNAAAAPRETRLASILILLGLFLTTGCSSLTVPKTAFSQRKNEPAGAYENGFELDPAAAEKVYQAVRAARANHGVVLQVIGDEVPVRNLPLPKDGRSIYVSQLLNETGVMNKLGGVEATLFRHSADTIGGIRMDVKMSKDLKSVRPESDYALQPGDRLRVNRAVASALAQLFDVSGLN